MFGMFLKSFKVLTCISKAKPSTPPLAPVHIKYPLTKKINNNIILILTASIILIEFGF